MKKPWAGRFREETSQSVESFTESISFDHRLAQHDIRGSISHAKMLARQRIITKAEADRIIKVLASIADEIAAGRFRFRKDLEDVHMNIEAELTRRIGSSGKKLHTARSRNDQVALDLRLYLRDEIDRISRLLTKLRRRLLLIAEQQGSAIMPGYTHLQRAQPVLLSHHLLAYAEMFGRDSDRFSDCLKRTNVSPLGACALAGTSLPTDPRSTAGLLGMNGIAKNSIDAVSDRDFALEFLAAAAICSMHLSRMAEELIVWSTEEFRFIEISDRFTTGSSIMPQKKNPDVAELVRGKTGRIYGNLMALLTIMKGLPLAYNRDMQEDKLPVFDTCDTLGSCLAIMEEMLAETRFLTERMAKTAGEGFSTATDLAEYLVRRGVPFREAHEITGRIVGFCIDQGKELQDLSLKEFSRFSKQIGPDISSVLEPSRSIRARRSAGGTAPSEVKQQIRRLKRLLR